MLLFSALASVLLLLLLVVSLLLLLLSLLLLPVLGSGVFDLSLLVLGEDLPLEVASLVPLLEGAVDAGPLPGGVIVLSSISLIEFNEETTSAFVDWADEDFGEVVVVVVVVVIVCDKVVALPFTGSGTWGALPDIIRSLLRAFRQAEVVASIESKVKGDCEAAGCGCVASPLTGTNMSSPLTTYFFTMAAFW